METYFTFDDVLLKPRHSTLQSRNSVQLDTSIGASKSAIELDLPVLSAPMDTVTEAEMASEMYRLGGIGIIHRYMSTDEQCDVVQRVTDNIREVEDGDRPRVEKYKVLAACNTDVRRASALIDAGASGLVMDVAHGDTKHVLETSQEIYDALRRADEGDGRPLLVGPNIATKEAAERLTDLGVFDALKVGIGSGSACSTRIITGVGVPQASAIKEVSEATTLPVIADGGIRSSGDMVKALALGADAVILGRVLAGTDECPSPLTDDGRYKVYRGMASTSALESRKRKDPGYDGSIHIAAPEGVSGLVEHQGPVAAVIGKLQKQVKLGFSYVGAGNIKELQEKAEFIRITQASLKESYPHDLRLGEQPRPLGH